MSLSSCPTTTGSSGSMITLSVHLPTGRSSTGSSSTSKSSLSTRSVVTVEQAEHVRSQWLELLEQHNNNNSNNNSSVVAVVSIDLSCRVWPRASLEVIRNVLEQVHERVVLLQLDDIIASLDTEAGLESLGFFADVFGTSDVLHTLILSDNAIGIRGVEILRPLLSSPNLQHLFLNNCGMSAEVATILKEILLLSSTAGSSTGTSSSSIQALALSRNQMGVEGAKAIGDLLAACTQLQHLEYAGSRPLKLGTWYLCQGLAQAASAATNTLTSPSSSSSSLKVLDLDDCIFGDGSNGPEEDPVYFLCDVLKACNTTIQKLILKDGGLEYDGLVMVLEALLLSTNTTATTTTTTSELVYLDLGALSLGTEGITKLAQDFLPQCPKLTHLLLETNELGDEGVQILLQSDYCCSCSGSSGPSSSCLQVLNLNDNDLTVEGLQAFIDSPISSRPKLYLKDNAELEDEEPPEELIQQLQSLYRKVIITEEEDDDDDEEEEDEQELVEQDKKKVDNKGSSKDTDDDDDDGDVDALAGELAGAHISGGSSP